MTGRSCTDEVRVKIPSFKKVRLLSVIKSIPQVCYPFIYKRTLKKHHHIFLIFLQTAYAIEKSRAGFNVQPRIGMNQSLI